ncbi:MAG: PIN domain-containing protein [Planctomycetaceae bacterium]|jgi:predicted nucleic acid-binding protein|nr:PIN domain-containing protein [Planctomycetaceae bacterium]
MIRVLIDTNVFLDYALKQSNSVELTVQIFQKIFDKKFEGCVSSSVITDVYYVIKKRTNKENARKFVETAYQMLTILPVNRKTIRDALESSMGDFEDAVQAFAARAMNVGIVVTRDKTGFADSGMTVFTPQEFLTYLEFPSK